MVYIRFSYYSRRVPLSMLYVDSVSINVNKIFSRLDQKLGCLYTGYAEYTYRVRAII